MRSFGSWRAPRQRLLSPYGVSLDRLLARNYLLDGGAELIIGHRPGVIEGDVTCAVEQNQGWCGAGTVQVEVLLTDRDRNVVQVGIEVLPDAFDVGKFIVWLRVFPLGGVTVELGGSEQGQTARTELGDQPGDHRTFGFTVPAPVGPEKKKYRRAVKLGKSCGLRAQVLPDL